MTKCVTITPNAGCGLRELLLDFTAMVTTFVFTELSSQTSREGVWRLVVAALKQDQRHELTSASK